MCLEEDDTPSLGRLTPTQIGEAEVEEVGIRADIMRLCIYLRSY